MCHFVATREFVSWISLVFKLYLKSLEYKYNAETEKIFSSYNIGLKLKLPR